MSFKENNSLQLGVKRRPIIKHNAGKKKLLVWSDSVMATTGFGVVSKHILNALYQTGRYEIHQLAINHFGDFYDLGQVPYVIQPARLKNPNDPYGQQMFIDALQKNSYDEVLVINDTFVVEDIAKKIEEVRKVKIQRNQKMFNLIYYYPVDCCVRPEYSTMIKTADVAVAYTNFAAAETVKSINKVPNNVIYHGTDINTFKPISVQERQDARANFFGIEDDETFILINVNRNSVRKDMARTLLAFSEFKKRVPNSFLYMHTKIQDGVGGIVVDLHTALQDVGLKLGKDVTFPTNFVVSKGFPEHVLNALYNTADAYFTTTLGEGWGLTITEAMACGVPVIVGEHTSVPEILGIDGERGYVYPCKNRVYIDNSGFRPQGYIEDIVDQMMLCYNDWVQHRKGQSTNRVKKIQESMAFVNKYSWNNVCKDWVALFNNLTPKPTGSSAMLNGEEI